MQTRKTKNIIIATGIYPPSIGGPATYAKMLSDELGRFGIKSSVLSFDKYLFLPSGVRHIVYFFKLYFLARDCDLIYALDPVSVGLPAKWVSWLQGKALFLRVAGDFAWEQGCQRYGVTDLLDVFLANNKYPSQVLRLRRIEYKVARYATKVIVPSEYLKRMVLKWGISAEKIFVIGNSFEGEYPQQTKAILRNELNFKNKTIITAGRLVPWKGFEVLIKGFAEYLKKNNVSLLVIGKGPDYKKLNDLVVSLELENLVTFIDNLSRMDLMRYLKASDAFVLNTAYEGFSHQILEAMMCEVPVVTTDVGGNPELIEDQKQGFLVGLNDVDAFVDRVDKILKDEMLANSLIQKAHQRATVFTKDLALEKLTALLP